MTDVTNMLTPENGLSTWRQLPQTIRDFCQATLLKNVSRLKANVEYRYRSDATGKETFLFNKEHYDTDPPVAFVLGEQTVSGVLVDITEYHHLETANGVEQWMVFLDVPKGEK